MAPRKTRSQPDPVLTDNVAKDGTTYPTGTKLSDLPEALRATVLTNPALFAEAEDDDGED